jgi:hypothetical protein
MQQHILGNIGWIAREPRSIFDHAQFLAEAVVFPLGAGHRQPGNPFLDLAHGRWRHEVAQIAQRSLVVSVWRDVAADSDHVAWEALAVWPRRKAPLILYPQPYAVKRCSRYCRLVHILGLLAREPLRHFSRIFERYRAMFAMRRSSLEIGSA